jgi:3-oxoacyl-[acyl-carrier-protein] synthase III
VKTSGTFINSLGTYLPELVPAQAPEDGAMTGAAVAGDTPAVTMALDATRQALGRWGQSTDLIALLLFVDVNHPGPDSWLPHSYLQRYAVGGHVLAAGIRQGCNGLFGALELAAGHLTALPAGRAAVVTTTDNVGSALLDRWTALDGYCMGDGATALVLSRTPGFARLCSITSTTIAELEEMHRGDEPLHPSNVLTGQPTSFQKRSDEFILRGGLGVDMAIRMVKTVMEVTSRALDEAGIGITDVTKLVPFNGPWHAISVYLDALGLPAERSTWEYGRGIGHSPSDHVLAIDHLLSQGELAPGDHLLLCGLGPGLSLAAAVIEIVDLPPWLTQGRGGHDD